MSNQPGPLPEWADACCSVCPAQRLGPGEFDVVERPYHGQAFIDGMRVDTASGTPVCAHAWRLGWPPGRYASAGEPLPTNPPDQPASATTGRPPIRGMGWHGPSYTRFVPTPDQAELPQDAEDLEAWLIAVLRTSPPNALPSALDHVETAARASGRFNSNEILTALRKLLATELVTQSRSSPPSRSRASQRMTDFR
jgi:hypothetical protein